VPFSRHENPCFATHYEESLLASVASRGAGLLTSVGKRASFASQFRGLCRHQTQGSNLELQTDWEASVRATSPRNELKEQIRLCRNSPGIASPSIFFSLDSGQALEPAASGFGIFTFFLTI
jgi:hypothetical protein